MDGWGRDDRRGDSAGLGGWILAPRPGHHARCRAPAKRVGGEILRPCMRGCRCSDVAQGLRMTTLGDHEKQRGAANWSRRPVFINRYKKKGGLPREPA